MAFNVNFNPSSTVSNWNNASTKFFHAKPGAILGNGFKQAATESTRKAGASLNSVTYKAANRAGEKLLSTMGNSGSKIGQYLTKVPGLNKVANGLSKLGKAGGNKIPGLGTVLALVTGVLGVGKSVSLAAKGDKAGAGHKLLKTAGSVGGILGGIALMATGVGFLPGLALAIGAGVAGDWAGKKAGDMICGKVDPQTGHSISYIKAQNKGQEQINTGYQNDLFGQNVALGSNEQFDAYLSSILN